MLATFALLTQVVATPIQAASDDRPVRLWLGPSPVAPGSAMPVYVAAANDGYLLVLRVATDGRVVVVFPADPKTDGFVARGAYTLRAPGGRPALVVSEGRGTGLVLAALSETPFRFGEFTRAGQWDRGLLAASYVGADGPGTLTDIAQRMVGDGWFNYDFALYTVRAESDARRIAAQRASVLPEPRAPSVSDIATCNGCTIVYQTVSPEPVLEQTVVERTIVEPVVIIASVCEPGVGGCHPSGFHRRRHSRREPQFKTEGICQIGIDCPPGIGQGKAISMRRATLGMSPIARAYTPATTPIPTTTDQPTIPVPAPVPLQRIVSRSKPAYVVISAPATQQVRRQVTSSSGGTFGSGSGTATVSAPAPRTMSVARAGGMITARQTGTALRAARLLRR